MNKQGVAFVSIVLGFILLATIIFFALGVEILATLGIVGIVFIVYVLITETYHSKYVKFDKSTQTLYVNSRCAKSAINIKIKRYNHLTYKYNAPEAIYTGATVGGVSMGGIHFTDPSYSVSGAEKTDRYQLYYGSEGVIKTISSFEFSIKDSIKENSILKKFLNKNGDLVLERKTSNKKLSSDEQYALMQSLKNNDYSTMSVLTKEHAIASKLTRNDCVTIISWIKGEI